MWNICSKVIIDKKWHNQNFDFQSLKSSSPGQFLGRANSPQYYWIFTSSCVLEIRSLKAKLCAAFLLFFFWNELWRFKVKVSMLFVEQKFLDRYTLCFSSYKNCDLKMKLFWVGARKRKKSVFVTFILYKGNFFLHLCFISTYRVFSEYIYFYMSKDVISNTCVFLKSLKAFSVSLSKLINVLSRSLTTSLNFTYLHKCHNC